MQSSSLQNIDPKLLEANSWNPNYMSKEDEVKLTNSVNKFGTGVIVARKLLNGSLEIVGGHHRVQIAVKLGIKKVPVSIYDNMSDDDAKLLGQVLNTRYGKDDSDKLSELLNSLSDKSILAEITPLSEDDIETLSFAMSSVDLDSLSVNVDDFSSDTPEPKKEKAPVTHVIMRFKIPIDTAPEIRSILDNLISEQGYDDKDSMIKDGDALVHALLNGDN